MSEWRPINVFEDTKGSDFSKHNKKQVTEDYVVENLKELNWRVYRPFVDTGIDLIASKKVCPHKHTPINISEPTCSICNAKNIEIFRFIQVKTREVKGKDGEGYFGYTLTPKDFRTDPRHVFLLYSDYTNDFLILPVYEYLSKFSIEESVGKTHFGVPSFRVGNNKVNSLRKDSKGNWNWHYGRNRKRISFNDYVNEKGIKLLGDPTQDINFNEYVNRITELKFKLFFNYCRGRQVTPEKEEKINKYLAEQIIENQSKIHQKRLQTKYKLKSKIDPILAESINGYLTKFKGAGI